MIASHLFSIKAFKKLFEIEYFVLDFLQNKLFAAAAMYVVLIIFRFTSDSLSFLQTVHHQTVNQVIVL